MSVEDVRSEQPRDFDPVNFTVVPPRRFQDLRVGDVFRAPSRTLTDAHAAAFQTVSADNHPIHYDVEYARRHGHIAPVVHGLQVFAFTAPGATLFPQYIGDVFIAFTVLTHLLGERTGRPGGMAVGAPRAACRVVSRSSPRLRAVSRTVVTMACAAA